MGSKSSEPSRTKLLLAFVTIYLLWGSTYLAIRLAIDTIPPFLMGGSRLFAAGACLYGLAVKQGLPRPTRRHWRNAAIISVPMFVMGNGGVTWAEQAVPSGVAALVIATLPAWLLLLDWGYGGRKSPKMMEVAGIGLGLVGVATLSAPGGINLVGAGVLVGAAIAWAVGSLVSRYADRPASPILNVGMQMLIGGALMVGLGLALGEGNKLDTAAVTWQSALAWLYLGIAAVVAMPAYNWLLTVTSPALVGTYAFVNPVVAVLVGWAVADETLSGRTGVAAVLVVLGVALLIWPKNRIESAAANRVADQRNVIPILTHRSA